MTTHELGLLQTSAVYAPLEQAWPLGQSESVAHVAPHTLPWVSSNASQTPNEAPGRASQKQSDEQPPAPGKPLELLHEGPRKVWAAAMVVVAATVVVVVVVIVGVVVVVTSAVVVVVVVVSAVVVVVVVVAAGVVVVVVVLGAAINLAPITLSSTTAAVRVDLR
jgi:hypothetical protein